MRAVLTRSVSGPVTPSLVLGSPREIYPGQDSSAGFSFPVKYHAFSPKSALHFDVKNKDRSNQSNGNSTWMSPNFRRAKSETELNRQVIVNSSGLASTLSLNCIASRSFPASIIEEDLTESFGLQKKLKEKGDEKEMIVKKEEEGVGSLILGRKLVNLGVAECSAGIMTEEQVLPEELEFSGGGTGKGRKIGGGKGGGGGDSESFTGGSADQNNIGVYYQEMLKANPGNPLLLRNYARFLHEFEKDTVKAEEYYGRAILASPGDGEVLSLYAKLIWETQRDEERANGYFDRAIEAAPDDCYVLGSYAHFLWDAEDDEETGSSLSLVDAC